MSIKISFIIPVYNCEKYIIRCLDSIYSQRLSLSDFEVICVNDCSTDNSRVLIECYSKRHNNLFLLNNDINRGNSYSRNRGLCVAKGEYVEFVDADDFLLKDITKRFLDEIDDDLDYMEFRFIHGYENKETYVNNGSSLFNGTGKLSGTEFIKRYANSPEFDICVITKIIRRDFLKKNNIIFINDVNIGEDGLFSLEVMLKAEKMKKIPEYGYVYFHRSHSITMSEITVSSLENLICGCICLKEMIQENVASQNDIDLFNACIVYYDKVLRIAKSMYKRITYLPKNYKYRNEKIQMAISLLSLRYNGYFKHKLPDKFINNIIKYDKIVIYGAGEVGKGLYVLLDDYGIRNKYLAVSDEVHISGNEQVINVFSRNKDAILIASEKFSNELNQNAVELGFRHVINMERYM